MKIVHDQPPVAEAAAEARVRRLVLPGGSGAYLTPDMELTILMDGHGLALQLDPTSALALARELVAAAGKAVAP